MTRAAAIAEVSRQMIHKMLRTHGMVFGLDQHLGLARQQQTLFYEQRLSAAVFG